MLLHDVISKWAHKKPYSIAFINADTDEEVSWQKFDQITDALAAKLNQLGFIKGDFLAAFLPFTTEQLFLEYACFKAGVVHVPLEIRLKLPDILHNLSRVKARGLALICPDQFGDPENFIKTLREHCPNISCFIHFLPKENRIDGTVSFYELMDELSYISMTKTLPDSEPLIKDDDPALIVFTSGSTGYPKPALLSHRNIICQNMCVSSAFGSSESARILVNLTPSHVGGQSLLTTSFFIGGTAILQPLFNPSESLMAIEKYKVNLLCQIPTMYKMEWQVPNYNDYDLSSLDLVAYSGQAVNEQFMEKLCKMAPQVGTGLALTESSCTCTYMRIINGKYNAPNNLGHDMPIYKLSIREAMKRDGSAGDELEDGEIGNVCFKGPQTFLCYLNDPEATSQAISTDNFLYTGDMGYSDDQGLHLTGRAKAIIKPKGFQVFPGQIEEHFCKLSGKVYNSVVIGLEHEVFGEAILAFIEKRPGTELTIEELNEHAMGLPSYMRPLNYVVTEMNSLPLSCFGKIDYIKLREIGEKVVEGLRSKGGWD